MNNDKPSVRRFYSKHPIVSHIIIMAATAVVLVWFAMIFLNVWTHHGSTSTVPQVKNLPYSTAAELLRDCSLSIEISDSVYDRDAAPGTVLESWPRAGAVVKRGRQVYVTVTAFSPKMVRITMPVSGVSSRQAVSYLRGLGITGIRIVSVPSQYPDLVESAKADGKMLRVDSEIPVTATVTLEVGSAPEKPQTEDVPYDNTELQSEDATTADEDGNAIFD